MGQLSPTGINAARHSKLDDDSGALHPTPAIPAVADPRSSRRRRRLRPGLDLRGHEPLDQRIRAQRRARARVLRRQRGQQELLAGRPLLVAFAYGVQCAFLDVGVDEWDSECEVGCCFGVECDLVGGLCCFIFLCDGVLIVVDVLTMPPDTLDVQLLA